VTEKEKRLTAQRERTVAYWLVERLDNLPLDLSLNLNVEGQEGSEQPNERKKLLHAKAAELTQAFHSEWSFPEWVLSWRERTDLVANLVKNNSYKESNLLPGVWRAKGFQPKADLLFETRTVQFGSRLALILSRMAAAGYHLRIPGVVAMELKHENHAHKEAQKASKAYSNVEFTKCVGIHFGSLAEVKQHIEHNAEHAGGLTATEADLYVIAVWEWCDECPLPDPCQPLPVRKGMPVGCGHGCLQREKQNHDKWSKKVKTKEGLADFLLNEGFRYYVLPVPVLNKLADAAIAKGAITKMENAKRPTTNSQCAQVPLSELAEHTLVQPCECVPAGFQA
jgi:hypothetical protein